MHATHFDDKIDNVGKAAHAGLNAVRSAQTGFKFSDKGVVVCGIISRNTENLHSCRTVSSYWG